MRRLCHHKSESQIQIRISQKISHLDVKEAEIDESGIEASASHNGSYFLPHIHFLSLSHSVAACLGQGRQT